MNINLAFWSLPADEALRQAKTTIAGLTNEQALSRRNQDFKKPYPAFIRDVLLFLLQFKKPLTLLLFVGLAFSAALGELTNAIIILVILLVSGTLGFFQERNAGRAVEKLRSLIQSKATVRRNNQTLTIPLQEVVDGDIILLKAGDIVPADSLLLESEDLYANESTLTGESYPAEKKTGQLNADTALLKRSNTVFAGTNIVSGTATAVAMATGKYSQLGMMEQEMHAVPQETAFEHGLRSFGYLLIRVALIMAGIILIINLSLGRSALDALLFALALSIGLTPEILPAIVTITLSSGAKRLAEKKVIVKNLSAIQNFGAIDILCSDKTGTLTEGIVQLQSCIDAEGSDSPLVRQYAYLNALYQSGYTNPLDAAIRNQTASDISDFSKFDEVPYDFIRKRLSVVAAKNKQQNP